MEKIITKAVILVILIALSFIITVLIKNRAKFKN